VKQVGATISLTMIVQFFCQLTATPPIFYDPDLAADRFRSDVAMTYAVPAESIEIVPPHPGIPGDGYFELGVDDLYAYQARFMLDGEPVHINGFASIGGVDTVLVLAPNGLGPLLSEARAFSPGHAMPIEQLVVRIAFVLQGFGKPAIHPDHPWQLRRVGETTEIDYLALLPDNTGIQTVSHVRIEAMRGKKPVVTLLPFQVGPVRPVMAQVDVEPWYPPFGTPDQ
jgi:hypothetical protein